MPCGSEPAREGAVSNTEMVTCATASHASQVSQISAPHDAIQSGFKIRSLVLKNNDVITVEPKVLA